MSKIGRVVPAPVVPAPISEEAIAKALISTVVSERLDVDVYWADLGWGCGAVFIARDRVVAAAPIFVKKLTGRTLKEIEDYAKKPLIKLPK